MGRDQVDFGGKLRELRRKNGLTLRTLAKRVGVDFTYLSKIENGKSGFLPGAETIRALAGVLETDALDLLRLADKVPPEIKHLAATASARRFLQRAREVASPDDWDALLRLLEQRQMDRMRKGTP